MNANKLWASVISGVTIFTLGIAILGAIYCRGANRAFFVGFALFGWAYMVVEFVQLPTINFDKNLIPSTLLLDTVMYWRYDGSSNWFFHYCGLHTATLLYATVGGIVAKTFHNWHGH